jgi:hypothetical protein
MAKALYGHVGLSQDMRLVSEVRRMRQRIGDLEAEVARLRALNESLTVDMPEREMITLPEREPALT